jgi:NADH dehydrogenase
MHVAVTGAFGYSGRYIAKRLLEAGHSVMTLTNSVQRKNTFGEAVVAHPFRFDDTGKLTECLRGVDALINTYWVRFDHRLFTHDQAVANTKIMFSAARHAGVRRIVHVSITNPDLHSDLPYFRGKAELEQAFIGLGISCCILRPAVLFGKEDVLINNIAWALRHLPVIGVFGSGAYKLQPIYVDDLAAAAVEKAVGTANEVLNAIGPETFTYRELVVTLGQTLGCKRPIISVPPGLGYWACRMLGSVVGDVVITREEIKGLMEGRLHVDAPPLGRTKLTDWVREHRDTLGRRYTSEMSRRLDRVPYGSSPRLHLLEDSDFPQLFASPSVPSLDVSAAPIVIRSGVSHSCVSHRFNFGRSSSLGVCRHRTENSRPKEEGNDTTVHSGTVSNPGNHAQASCIEPVDIARPDRTPVSCPFRWSSALTVSAPSHPATGAVEPDLHESDQR